MTTSDVARVHTTIEGAVATLTLDVPRRKNAMTPELGERLVEAVQGLRGHAGLRAVVLTGAGDAFSGGGDLEMLERLRASDPEESRAFMWRFYRRYLSVTELEVPVIASVRGAAIGAGLCVALACDLCVVDADAKLALNFAQLGLHPGMGATYLAPLRVGPARAAELLLTGRRFTGRELTAWGGALEAVAAEEVLPRAQALAASIASSAPAEVRALRSRLGLDRALLARALDHEALEQARSYRSSDLGEGLKAAAERRAPLFTGG